MHITYVLRENSALKYSTWSVNWTILLIENCKPYDVGIERSR
jgi:hypothetical protein